MGWAYSAVLVTTAINLLLVGFALRRLGPDDYGLYAIIAATVSLLTTLEFSLSMIAVRASVAVEGHHNPTARGELQAVHAIYFAFGVCALALTVVSVAFLLRTSSIAAARRGDIAFSVLAVGAAVAFSIATASLNSFVLGQRNFRLAALATSAGSIGNLVFVLVALGRIGVIALAVGQLLATLVTRLVMLHWVRNHLEDFQFLPTAPSLKAVRTVLAYGLPLLAISLGGQLVVATDLAIIGAISSATAAGLYRVGSLMPVHAVSFLYRGYDAAFPSLVATTSSVHREAAVRFLTRLFSYVAGLGLGLLAVLRSEISELLIGEVSQLASQVLLVFCAVWIINTSVHGLVLLLVAAGNHRSLTPLVAAEAACNVLLTLLLVSEFGAVGAAYATLITLAVSNVVVLPRLVTKACSLSAQRMVLLDGLLPSAIGVAVALAVTAPIARFATSPLLIPTAMFVVAVAGGGVGVTLLGHHGRKEVAAMLRRSQGVGGNATPRTVPPCP